MTKTPESLSIKVLKEGGSFIATALLRYRGKEVFEGAWGANRRDAKRAVRLRLIGRGFSV